MTGPVFGTWGLRGNGGEICVVVGLSWDDTASGTIHTVVQFLFWGWLARAQPPRPPSWLVHPPSCSVKSGQILNQDLGGVTGQLPRDGANQPRE